MAPLIVLVLGTLLARGIGQLGLAPLRDWAASTRVGLAAMLCLTAVAHFNHMRPDLVAMVPPSVPNPEFMVTFTGICEILGAVGLLVPRTRRIAAVALIVFLVAVLPANIHAAQAGVTLRGAPATPLVPRIALQALFIGLVWWSGVRARDSGGGDANDGSTSPVRSLALIPVVLVPVILAMASCGHDDTDGSVATADANRDTLTSQTAFWGHLRALCPGAAEGRLLRVPDGDTQIDPGARLVVHFRECGEEELRFPLHVDENRSRTWVFIRHENTLELRHDHRHEDGLEESNTWYGASTADEGTATRQEFVFERDSVTVGWRVEIEPGRRFTYGTTRDGEWRHHLEFDLTRDAEIPPPPWGHETRPSQRPDPMGRGGASERTVPEEE